MQDLVERGFDTMGITPVISKQPVYVAEKPGPAKPVQTASALRLRKNKDEFVTVLRGVDNMKIPEFDQSWSVQLGAFGNRSQAESYINQILTAGLVTDHASSKSIEPISRNGLVLYRTRLNGLSSKGAHGLCQNLVKQGHSCLAIAPGR